MTRSSPAALGRAFSSGEDPMRDAASLLERKRKLLARRQEGNVEHLAAVERELKNIDDALTRLEANDAPPTAPILPAVG